MLLKVNTSNTDNSGIYTIAFGRMVSMNAVGLTKLDVIFESAYGNQNPVFRFTITSNKADTVIRCLQAVVDKCFGSVGVCTLYDEYSNYKCCPDITGVEVKMRKV